MSYPTPIRFDMTSTRFKQNPWTEFERMRNSGAVVSSKLPIIGGTWFATTYESVNDMLRDQKTFVRELQTAGGKKNPGLKWWMPKFAKLMSTSMISRDEPDHRRLRSLVEQAFLRQSVESLRDRIGVIADQFVDEMTLHAEADGRVDLMSHFARQLPFIVICELLGVSELDRPMLVRLMAPLSSVKSMWGVLAALPGLKKVLNYFRRQFDDCRQKPRPGLISDLVHVELEGDRLTEDELLAMVILLFFAGHETTVHLISNGVLCLLQHPDQKQKLFDDWGLIDSAVEEIHRYASPVQMTKPRFISRDREFHGVELKKGQMITAILASANCDPAKFDRPTEFDIQRSPNPHVGFGVGIHVCLGLKLARVETQIALATLFQRFPDLELAEPDGRIQWNKRIGLRALRSLTVQINQPATSRVDGKQLHPDVAESLSAS